MNGGADINYKEAIGLIHVDFECFNKGRSHDPFNELWVVRNNSNQSAILNQMTTSMFGAERSKTPVPNHDIASQVSKLTKDNIE